VQKARVAAEEQRDIEQLSKGAAAKALDKLLSPRSWF
jgi:hypothetical protein